MYKFTNEQGKERILTTKEEAQKVIAATATTHCMTKDEVVNSSFFKEISEIFNINLSQIRQYPGENWMDYAYIYSF